MNANELTANEVRRLLTYDKYSGVFTWRVDRGGKARAGCVAGTMGVGGYRQISLYNRLYSAHRLAFLHVTGSWPSGVVDHKDGNPSNNSWDNLRDTTQAENSRNSRGRTNNTSGYTGVCWARREQKWFAQIKVDGKTKSLGRFDNIDDAVQARLEAERVYGFTERHGELNLPNRFKSSLT